MTVRMILTLLCVKTIVFAVTNSSLNINFTVIHVIPLTTNLLCCCLEVNVAVATGK